MHLPGVSRSSIRAQVGRAMASPAASPSSQVISPSLIDYLEADNLIEGISTFLFGEFRQIATPAGLQPPSVW